MRKISLMLSLLLAVVALCGAALAEDTAALIIDSRTTQAFTDEAVPEEDLNTILQAGLAAPSAINQQPWFFAVVTNRDVLDAIGQSAGGARAGLGDSPVAIVVYMDENTKSPNPNFDCGLACENMVIAARALGYGVKIVISPIMQLNGEKHDALCERMGVDPACTGVAVILIGREDAAADRATGASVRNAIEEKVSFVK